MADRIRAVAVCVFRHEDRVLVADACDGVTGQRFMRPLGGEIEFGERAVEALERGIREKIQADIEQSVLLGVLENIFVYEGVPRHQIVFVFDARFLDASFYERDQIPVAEDIWVGPARWVTLSALGSESLPLYPKGLLELLIGSTTKADRGSAPRGLQ